MHSSCSLHRRSPAALLAAARGWARSRAKVFVYSGNRFVRAFYVTPGKVGNLWVVFSIDGGATKDEAQAYLKTVQATGLFDGANVRKMQVVVKQ